MNQKIFVYLVFIDFHAFELILLIPNFISIDIFLILKDLIDEVFTALNGRFALNVLFYEKVIVRKEALTVKKNGCEF